MKMFHSLNEFGSEPKATTTKRALSSHTLVLSLDIQTIKHQDFSSSSDLQIQTCWFCISYSCFNSSWFPQRFSQTRTSQAEAVRSVWQTQMPPFITDISGEKGRLFAFFKNDFPAAPPPPPLDVHHSVEPGVQDAALWNGPKLGRGKCFFNLKN